MSAARDQGTSARRDQGGYKLAEVVVILAVVLLLTGLAVPMISSHVDDDRRTTAAEQAGSILAAVTAFYKHTGSWPARSAAGFDNTIRVLCSGPAVPETNPFGRNHRLSTWLLDELRGDVLDNHLLRNAPGGNPSARYSTTDPNAWRGPYLKESAPLDPWGRPFLVTVYSGFSTSQSNFKRLFVLSAGPNGIIETNPNLDATTDLAGDDIGVLVSQRL